MEWGSCAGLLGMERGIGLVMGKLGSELADGLLETPAVAGVEGTVTGVAETPYELSGGPINVSTSSP